MELGPYPFEALAHGPPLHKRLTARARAWVSSASPLGRTAEFYRDLFVTHASRASAPRGAGSTEPNIRSRELKGAAYYLDADHVGVCEVPDWVWYEQPLTQRSCALVLQVFPGRAIDPDNLAHAWVADAQGDLAYVRALEIALSLMGHIHALGFAAECHHPQATSVCLDTLAVNAGIALWDGERIRSPFLPGQPITIAVVTDYALQVDPPLASAATVNPLQHWLGINGARSGREQRRRARRPAHESFYPMEQVKRVATPTTLIFADEVPRVPKRAEFFQRARSGDLGNKAQQEVQRFAVKHPLTQGMMPQLRCMVPHQDGEVATEANPDLDDPQRNTAAIKALSYHLGADLTGICEIPRYAWYSHNAAGEEIEMRHRYAVVMLIDQGYDTMEGASGDDWISGCQSMRGYIRGAQIAGVMAEFLRGQGFSSRAQTNADSEVLQIPLVLLAGLGELSRIGELVLNPFVGPRFKSVVLTTNLPLVVDQPVDFGLQTFCENCRKCARECPVNAIPFGDKVFFNGYEIWKPDVERCTRYRVTNPKGSACGRCMKTCPLNKVVHADGPMLHRVGSWLGINARWLKPLLVPAAVSWDDSLGFGRRNPIKRWWQDLEIVDGVAQTPTATNERDLNLNADVSGAKSPVGYYYAADMPPGNSPDPYPVNHKQAVARADLIESVSEARSRRAAKKRKPDHYIPTRALD